MTKRRILIDQRGSEPLEVNAIVCGQLAVHLCSLECCFTLTHVATGFAVVEGYRSEADAVSVAKRWNRRWNAGWRMLRIRRDPSGMRDYIWRVKPQPYAEIKAAVDAEREKLGSI